MNLKAIIFLLVLVPQTFFSLNAKPDSLLKILNTTTQDTIRFKVLMKLGAYYKNNNPDSSFYFYNKASIIGEVLKDNIKKADALTGIAWSYFLSGKSDKSLETCDQALLLLSTTNTNENKMKKVKATAIGYKGAAFYNQGDYDKALDYFFEALKLNEEVGNYVGQANNLGNIGVIYYLQKNYPKTLEYYLRTQKLYEKTENKSGLAENLSNIGALYQVQEIHQKALEYYILSNKIAEEINYQHIIASNSGNIGQIYVKKAQELTKKCKCNNDSGYYAKALEKHLTAKKIDEETSDTYALSQDLANIGDVYMKQKKYSEAEPYLLNSMRISKEAGILEVLKAGNKYLSELYEATGKTALAFKHYKLYTEIKDSLLNDENIRSGIDREYKFNYMKKAATDSVAFAKEKEIQNIKTAKAEAELAATRNRQLALYGGLCLLAIFGGVMYNRFKVTKKQKGIIEDQKQIVEQKQKEILDSIQYAKRIQRALLPSEKYIHKNIKQSKNK